MTAWVRYLRAHWLWQEVLLTLLIILFAWLAARIFLYLVDRFGRRWVSRTPSLLDDYILHSVRRPVACLIVLIGVYAAIHRYRFPFRTVLDGITFVAGVLLVCYTLIRVLAVGLRWYGERLSVEKGTDSLTREVLPLVDKTGKVLLLAIGLVVILDHFRIEIKSILVTLGVGSLAIGLALQDTLANMFGGFTIMLDRPFRVGDRIRLASGEMGDVQMIGIRSTRVLTLEAHLLVIPNAHLVKTMVTNESFPDDRARVIVEVGIAHDADPSRAKAILLEIAATHPLVLKDPPPAAYFQGFGDWTLKLIVVCHTADFRHTMPIRDEINTAIHARFREQGIRIPFPTRTVELHNQ